MSRARLNERIIRILVLLLGAFIVFPVLTVALMFVIGLAALPVALLVTPALMWWLSRRLRARFVRGRRSQTTGAGRQ